VWDREQAVGHEDDPGRDDRAGPVARHAHRLASLTAAAQVYLAGRFGFRRWRGNCELMCLSQWWRLR